MTTIGEYLDSGVITKLSPEELHRTRSWVPVFPRPKKDSQKIRLITDLRDLNTCHQVPRHRPETWKTLLQTLQQGEYAWACTLDLHNWFHHLEMHPKMGRWMRIKVGGQAYQLMPFGWAMSPWWSQKMCKPIRAWLHTHNIRHAWYVDDVMVLGRSSQEAEENTCKLVVMLTQLGVRVNKKKSMTQAAQQVQYLGHMIDLEKNQCKPLQEKCDKNIKMIRKQISGRRFQPRNLAALAGALMDMAKSITQLHGVPQQLMQQAGAGARQNQQMYKLTSMQAICGRTTQKSLELQDLLQQALQACQDPVPKFLRPSSALHLKLMTDASNKGWGASLTQKGVEWGACAQERTPE